MRISRDREKLADAVISFVSHTKYCGITKLLKLLFFLDFTHFREAGRSVTGLTYRAWSKGPAPADVWSEVKRGATTFLADAVTVNEIPDEETARHFTKISPRRAFDGKYFSRRERRILDELVEIYRDAKANELVEITHLKNSPWCKTLKKSGPNSTIDYMLALDGKSTRELPRDEIEARVAEFAEEI